MNKKKSLIGFIAENNIVHIMLAILLGFVVGTIFLAILQIPIGEAYSTLFYSAFRSVKSRTYCFVYSAPYVLTGLSVAFAFKTGVFNIGAEGQFVIGSLAACVVGILFGDLPRFILVPLCFISAMLAGAILAIIVGFLKNKFNVNEVLSMIMLNWLAFYFSNFIVELPIIKAVGSAQSSKNISDNARILLSQDAIKTFGYCSKANYGILIAFVIAIILYFIINKTVFGYRIKAVGYSKTSAEYAGINVKKYTLLSLAIAGALSGLAGAIQLMGLGKRVSIYTSQEGFGFAGIVVALIGACNPIGVFFSGVFYGTLKFAGRSLNLIGAPTQVIDIIVGTIVFFISISGIFGYLKNLKKKNDEKGEKVNG